jgi:predicted membrane-bound spermidine synthase
LLAGASGVIALAYEIIWYRVFSFATAGNAREFAYVLGMYLNGIAFGALLAERICRSDQRADAQRRLTGVIIIVGNLVAFAVAPVASYMVKALRIPNLAFILVSGGALLLGAVLPLTCHLTIKPDTKAGSGLSRLYFSNIIGSTIGSFFVGYVLMDFMSTAQVSLLLVTCGMVLGFLVLAWRDVAQTKLRVALAVISVVAVGVVWRMFPGMWERFLPGYQGTPHFEYLIENRSGVVGVLSDKTVIGGGAYDGLFNVDPLQDANGIFRAYALSALHPAPRDVLMIGLSSGSWAQVIANNPAVEHFTIVEINPGYLSLIPRYGQVRSVLSNPKVTLVIDDGRRWLRRHPDKFDAVVMNTTFHWRANVTNLLSVEFLQLVRQHLKSGGIFYYNTTHSPEVQLTGATVFPYLVRVWTFVAVSDSPIVVNKQRWLDTMQRYTIDGQSLLEPRNAGANKALLDNYAKWVDGARGGSDKQMIEYADTLRARYKGRGIVTDDNMACEWRD